MINVDCIYLKKNIYEDDNNEMCSWVYKGHPLRKITNNYKCNFSQHPHTSIEYKKDESSKIKF
jgi:hypothetical protein